MTYSILPIVGITLSLTAIAGNVMAISSHLPEDEIKNLNSIDISSLWTSKPSLVDPSKQNFERLPALVTELPKSADLTPAVDNIVASATQLSRKLSHPNLSGEGETASVGLPSSFQAGTEAAKWCAER
ncbi:hypothetical protein [Rhizobium sp. Root1204]|uniref:hypothetical protein n=1 Tax=Rhizobium sp. Root1204 TaxID=1736428 RepID=UPI000715FE91|nr:hypothetical protein [Rhizobium sp. Root1204]KQV36432.1 hypothetical protein ASC96_27965 [Rhizobium sp. Root1204]